MPGGDVNGDLADALTGQLPGVVPASLVALAAVVLVVWMPFRRSAIGRAAYAVGSSRESPPTCRACRSDARSSVAYMLSGLLAAMGGLFLTFFTYSGEASAANGGTYTLYSIAAVVLGGVSLFGGSGSAIGAIFGALMFRTIGDLLFVFNLDPLWQPLFQGVVLLRRSASARRGCSRSATGSICSHERAARSRKLCRRAPAQRIDPAGRDRLRLHRRAAARRQSSIRAASCRPNICCSS